MKDADREIERETARERDERRLAAAVSGGARSGRIQLDCIRRTPGVPCASASKKKKKAVHLSSGPKVMEQKE